MPILSVKRIIEMPLQLMTSQALFLSPYRQRIGYFKFFAIGLDQWFLTFLRTRTPWAFINFSRTPCLKASSNCCQRSSYGVTNSSAAI